MSSTVRFEASPFGYEDIDAKIFSAYNTLYQGTGENNNMRDWLSWPQKFCKSVEYRKLKNVAERIRSNSEHVIVIGIGGSYLGAKAIIEAECAFYNSRKEPKIYFAGNDLSSEKMLMISDFIEDEDFSIVYISKSGGTIEPAIAFRFFYDKLLKKYGKYADCRVYAITDANKGTLHDMANSHYWESFVIPDGIGGRYSVFTPVGLLPIAIAGINTDEILLGAIEASKLCEENEFNPAIEYAQWRYTQFTENYLLVEFMAANRPDLLYFCEWWKQLFGESEGKDHKGMFPTSGVFPTDLHSLGQFLQEGTRDLICETQLIRDFSHDMEIPDVKIKDNLDALVGRTISEANNAAMEGSFVAHSTGNFSNSCSKWHIGQSLSDLAFSMQIMMTACAISAYAIDVNPFNQPGVEEHKIRTKEILFQ